MQRSVPIKNEPTAPAEPGRRTLTFKRASDVQVRPVRWLWDERIALGTLALVGGREGIGKSTLCYQLVADITCGRMRGAFYGSPRATIIAATEDSWEHTIVPRLMAAGADLDLVYQVAVQTAAGFDGSLNLPTDIGALERMAQKVGAAAVLLDPLLSRLEASLDSHKDADVRRALEPLVAFADRAHVALAGIIHVNKGLSTDPLTMLMASRAFAAVARSVLFVAQDQENKGTRILGQPKNNLGRGDLPDLAFTIEGKKVADTKEGAVWTSCLVWQGESRRSLDDVIAGVREPAEVRTETKEAADWLTDYLTLYQVASSAQVKAEARKAGFSQRTVERAREKIGAGMTSHGFPRCTYWSAPGLSPDETDKSLAALPSGANTVAPTPPVLGATGATGATGQNGHIGDGESRLYDMISAGERGNGATESQSRQLRQSRQLSPTNDATLSVDEAVAALEDDLEPF